jgi:spore coat polysaccharide biosynthesis protein SpsF
MSKVVAIIQARCASTRFPLKVLASLGNKPIISHVLERATRIEGVDQVVLAIPHGDAARLGHIWRSVRCGPEEDVLSRYVEAAEYYLADVVVRITADCPLLPTDWAAAVVRTFLHAHTDRLPLYLGACQPMLNVCDGFDVEVFSMEALRYAHVCASMREREHVTTFMRHHAVVVDATVLMAKWPALNGPFKLSVDTKDELAFVEAVYRKTGETAGAYESLVAAHEVACIGVRNF